MINSLYDKFKPWCQNGSIWIISDTHFDDSDCKRIEPNWPTPTHHIDHINRYVQPSDTLIHLGDVGNYEWIEKIKARYKVLITGNHDKPSLAAKVFNEVYNGPLFIADRILLSHEPIYGLERFAINIHGHNHNGLMATVSHINLAANVIGYAPVNLGRLIKYGILSETSNYHRITIDSRGDRKE